MRKEYTVDLSAEEREQLLELTKRGSLSARKRRHPPLAPLQWVCGLSRRRCAASPGMVFHPGKAPHPARGSRGEAGESTD